MKVNFATLRILVAAAWICLRVVSALGQEASQFANCDNPPVLNSLVISNATCGQSNGFIIIGMQGGNSAFAYEWTPAVSLSASVFDVPAGFYRVRITRLTNPNCILDTILTLSNSDGPEILNKQIAPANCLASNGSITLNTAPANMQFVWSNGQNGPTATALADGCYTTTITNTSNGCFSLTRTCVPNVNPLVAEVEILAPAKCGLPKGQAAVNMSGGSGNYTYSFGAGNIWQNLPEGQYAALVNDLNTGCTLNVPVLMPAAPVEGEVELTVNNVKCPGQGDGNIEFTVIPGAYFELPFAFSLTDGTGFNYSPGALPPGLYFLEVRDADNCPLPVKTFSISSPPDFEAVPFVAPGDCDGGAGIALNFSGGNGVLLVDWDDIPGYDNPPNRSNLRAGIYSATIYDSLFCYYALPPILAPDFCPAPDTLLLTLAVNETASLRLPYPPELPSNQVAFSLIPPVTALFGAWTLLPGGQLRYAAGNLPAAYVDPVLIRRHTGIVGLDDTICARVLISAKPVQRDSVYFAVQSGSTAISCGALPPTFTNPQISLTTRPGLLGFSDVYGAYSVSPLTACLNFQASPNVSGYNIDTIGVVAYMPLLQEAQLIYYIPSVLPANGCNDGISLEPSLFFWADECDDGVEICVEIPFGAIGEYAIGDNGSAYTSGPLSACSPAEVWTYQTFLDPTVGPFRMARWEINGQVYSAFFYDGISLNLLMNQLDPGGNWVLESGGLMSGGLPTNTYGPMEVFSALNDEILTFVPQKLTLPRRTRLRVDMGEHLLSFRRAQTGCLDQVEALVACPDCPPPFAQTPDPDGIFRYVTGDCARDTVFCTGIPASASNFYRILDNETPAKLTNCGDFLAISVDTGFHRLHIYNRSNYCLSFAQLDVRCTDDPGADVVLARPDQAVVLLNTPTDIPIIQNDVVDNKAGNFAGIAVFSIVQAPAHGSASYNPATGLLTYTPDPGFCGEDSLVYLIANENGRASSAQVRLTVLCESLTIYSGFSPNGDNLNDFWRIDGIEAFPANEVRIYNRWGDLVFEEKGYQNQRAWDGASRGAPLPDGTYFYVIHLRPGAAPLSGYVQLMR